MIFYIHECEEKIGYSFKDKNLLRQCFTHASYAHEHKNQCSNERLEFFGDAILEYCVSEYLYDKYPNEDEGELTRLRQNLVSAQPLSNAIKKSGLDEFILYGNGELNNKKNDHFAACENLFEAIVAGLYIDGGIEAAKSFINDKLIDGCRRKAKPRQVENEKPSERNVAKVDDKKKAVGGEDGVKNKDPKSALQEYVQKYKLGVVEYVEKSRKGPPHDPTFECSVSVGGREISVGEGKRKSEAEKAAADKALKKVRKAKGAAKKDKEKK